MTLTPDHDPRDGRSPAPNRRALLRAGIAFGVAIPFATTAASTLADEGHPAESTPAATPPAAADEHAGTEDDHGEDHGADQAAHTEAPDPSGPVQPFTRYDPWLPAVQPGPKTIEVVARDANLLVAPDVAVATWTYDGAVPGRAIRVVEGDTVDVTFRVDAAANAHHSLDFHAAKTPPDLSFATINPGEELRWSFTPKHPGAWMYHCGTPPALLHIGAGMYGAIIVDPKEGWAPAQELILVQSEFYLADGANGIKVPDVARMERGADMDYVTFNGHATQYVDEPIVLAAGEPVRIFVVNAGPNIWSSFHVVGTVFDRAYINASPKNQLFDLQSISVGPGDGACVEFTLDEPGTYPVVNHAFGHAAHGALALLQAE
jgi:nitrite reductase (NO-forming)